MRRISSALLALAFAGGLVLTSVTPAHAYGNSGPAKQTYQLTFSQSCNNKTQCPDLGGFWGWAVLYSDGTGNAELTGCGHLTGPGGGGGGAQHFHDDFTYDLSNTTEFVTLSETQTFVGKNRETVTVPGDDTGIPLIPGHYNTTDLLGFSAPGVTFQVTVVKLH